jgi:hypothetical protein
LKNGQESSRRTRKTRGQNQCFCLGGSLFQSVNPFAIFKKAHSSLATLARFAYFSRAF